MQLPHLEEVTSICSYESFPSEVDTHAIIKELIRLGKDVVPPERTQAKTADLFIVPGLAFDLHGHRVGRGGGFYDRLLKDVSAPKIALAFDFQVLAEVPHTLYDISMTTIVTEKRIISL